ncbi:serine-rich adhesin for platelets [Diabrotica virgifera virgifera]|uniref:Serpin domain-containing protein n=1 Tax=Diabrotica virgifera virgifera TaxID=50390 RepID=A0ABM5IWC5_DIAVI|nr:serine-rich adhesin for platelets [Diabrotica virgifera virgifera]
MFITEKIVKYSDRTVGYSKMTCWMLLLCCTSICTGLVHRRPRPGASWNGHEFHTYPHPAQQLVVPRSIMVDVVNDLGLKLLAIHNENNEDNIAISPYGAVSILIALGEGLQGEAVRELQQAAHIPNDISIIRVGLRDIHRHLKSYFIPKEGFLAGLTLNHENVTLRSSYVDTLKYYGFDITSFNSGLYPPPPTTERPSLTTTDTPGREMTMEMTLPPTATEQQPKLDTTVVTASVTVKDMVTTTNPTTTLTTEETTAPTTTIIPMISTELSTMLPTELTTTITTLQPTTTPNSEPSTLKIVTTEVPTTSTTVVTTEVSMRTTEEVTKITREIKDNSITPSITTEEMYTTLATSPTSTSEEPTTVTTINIDTTTKVIKETMETTAEEVTTTEINTENVPMEISSTTDYTTQADTTVISPITTTTESAILETTSKIPDTTIITTIEPIGSETETTTEIIMLETILVTLPSEISTTVDLLPQTTPTVISTQGESFPQTTITETTTDSLIEETTTEPSLSKETSTEASNEGETFTPAKSTATTIESVTFDSTLVPTEISTVAESFTQTQVTEKITTEAPATEIKPEVSTNTEAEDSTKEISTETESVPETTTLLSYPYPDASTPEIETSKDVDENEVFASDSPTLPAKRKRSKNSFKQLNSYKHRPRSTYTSDYNEYLSGKNRKLASGIGDSKRDPIRRTRSVVDYVIARYYDDYHSNNHHNLEPYVPQMRPSFLIQGKYRENQIEFMKYDTVLPFFYVSHLKVQALSFPLDSPKYYLLILLPVQENGVDRLICELRFNGSLKYIIENLRLRHVTAVIPSFMLKGYVNLTPTLQKLGIRRVFEPNQADFSPMTSFREIFVTNIEQAITVNIRNYVEPDPIVNRREFRQDPPVDFRVDRPFLYFVVDTELHVTLMAGKIVNPLNTRIT